MRRGSLLVLAALCLVLSGCGALLERSYSSVEPYTNRYWDSGAEDTLRAESYQDLVNSLLMLVEQGAEEGSIRCYEEANSYIQAQRARTEVRRETTLGSYLLDGLLFTYESGTAYSTVTYQITYREGTEDVEGLMSISDSQSLLDLLRLAVREEHQRLTARFSYDTPTADVTAAVESLWREMCLGESGAVPTVGEETVIQGDGQPPEEEPSEGGQPSEAGQPSEEANQTPDSSQAPPDQPDSGESGQPKAETAGEQTSGQAPEVSPAEQSDPAGGEDGQPPDETAPVSGSGEGDEPVEECPPCPWTIRFYPDRESAEIVEILLNGQWPKA